MGLLIALSPFEVTLSVSGCQGRQRSINDVPEALVFEHQGNHLAPLRVVVAVVVKWIYIELHVLQESLSWCWLCWQ